MDVAAAVAALATLVNTLSNMAQQASVSANMIHQAQAEGRTTFTAAEWATIDAAHAAARQALVDAIAKVTP